MEDRVINWILEEDNPSVRYFTMESLLTMNDKEVKSAKESIMKHGLVPKILQCQNQDGFFGASEKFYTQKYKGTVWTLLILAELGADPLDEQVKKSCEFILNHSQDPITKGFSYTQSKKNFTGLTSGVIPCLTGNMVYTLIKLGYIQDERVQNAINWIVKFQRTDDGLETSPSGGFYERYEACFGKHTCHMGAAKALKALAAIPCESRNNEVKEKIGELAEYFLKHHIYKKSHNLKSVAKPGWLRPGFPLMYQTDIFEMLEIFADLKIIDSRLKDPINIVKSKRNEDGKWVLETSNNGKTIVNIEEKGMPSKWITLRAVKILNFYENQTIIKDSNK
ncbi:MAG: nitrogen fixation protein NifH [Solirubrobacterales bacterium]